MCQVLELYNRSCGHDSYYRLLIRCSHGFSFSARSCKANNNRIVACRPLSNYRSCTACDDEREDVMRRAQRIYMGEIQEQVLNGLMWMGLEVGWEEGESDESEYDSNEDDGDSEVEESSELEESFESGDECQSPPIVESSKWLEWQERMVEDDSESGSEMVRADKIPHWQYFHDIAICRRLSYDSIDIETPRKKTHGAELAEIIDQDLDEMDICESSEAGNEDASSENDADESEADVEGNGDWSDDEAESGYESDRSSADVEEQDGESEEFDLTL